MTDRGKVRGLALAGALALALAACGGSSGSPAASSGGGASQAASTPAANASGAPAASTSSGGSGNAISALSDLNSYKVKLAITSKGTTSGVAAMGNITMSGIVVLKPAKASDITMSLGGSAPGASAGASAGLALGLRMVEVNGKSYIDMGTGTLTESTDSSQTSMADSLAPDKLLGETASYLKDMKSVGDEQKNGIATSHYHADDAVLKEAATGLSMLGLTNATWNWDVWTAKDGGYVVSYQLKGSDTSGAELAMTLDISDVNSSSNVVKGP